MESHQNPKDIEYWRRKAESYQQRANDIQLELDEYTENSASLEKELDATVLQLEKQNKDLIHQNKRLENEVESLKNKLERMQMDNNSLENDLKTLQMQKDKQNEYVRELEQKNDDLERGQRVVTETVSCIEGLLNQAYERNAVLESEVDEKETLKIELQRISDEARDLKQELKVKDRIPTSKKEEDNTNENVTMNGHVNTSTQVDTDSQFMPVTPQKREVNGNAMTPSSRVTALNIVGDLLRKVGLEKFLCRECGRVKCTCDTPPQQPTTPRPIRDDLEPSCFGYNGSLANESAEDVIEYRNKRHSRHSNPDCNSNDSSRLSQRSSEQPFSRFGESGKLRKSFAVRSREGIENLFSFSTFKKNDTEKLKTKQDRV